MALNAGDVFGVPDYEQLYQVRSVVDEEHFTVVPYGGGVPRIVHVAELPENIATVDPTTLPIYAARFQVEVGPIYPGYARRGERWNGWAKPCFERPIAVDIAADFVRDGSHAAYQAKTDTFLFRWQHDRSAVVEYPGYDLEVNGQVIHVYGIGAGDWIWSEVD